jgi:hypothetical protein
MFPAVFLLGATAVKISFQPPNRKTAGNIECNGVSVPNIFINLPFSHPLYIIIWTEAPKTFDSFVTEPGQRLKLMDARVLIHIPQVGAQRQVDAVNLLCRLKTHWPHTRRNGTKYFSTKAGA